VCRPCSCTVRLELSVQGKCVPGTLTLVALCAVLLLLQLHAAYSGSINMQGYLLKHRPVTQLMGLFAQEWEMRWGVSELLGRLV
jgi:hypothetical protein